MRAERRRQLNVRITGKVALVTGAGTGIGRATARRLAREGAAVVVNDIDERGGRATARILEREGGRSAFFRADVTNEREVRGMIAFAGRTFGGLDILVNNAGPYRKAPCFPQVKPPVWGRLVDANLRGTMLCTQYGIEALRRRGGGAIVNVASVSGLLGYEPDSPEFSAAKAGVMRFTVTLAPLKAQMNIRVNCVCPDWVETELVQRKLAALTAKERHAIGTLTSLDEIADAVLKFIRNDALSGRILVCWRKKRWQLLPARSRT